MNSTVTLFDALLLDDVNDPRAAAMLIRWQAEYGITCGPIRSSAGAAGVIRGGVFA